eukprot:TRINITY_DN6882_c0_g1_i1.p1 TRINITY_DN6882_c0_g1~~TRINITY_DN6882_c0_g1_i1.p1  ORF type:complete len:460 (+),score=164.74 TRINITY_DN6882_c0_g1_i1:48-1382(+)
MHALKTMLGTASGAAQAPAGPAWEAPPLQLLVIQSDAYDWGAIMAARRARDGRAVRVVQTSWRDLLVGPCGSTGRVVPTTSALRALHEAGVPAVSAANDPRFKSFPKRSEVTCTVHKEYVNGKVVGGGKDRIVFTPDFVLIREEVTTPTSKTGRNELLGLMYANVPSVNSLRSVLMFCDKPVVQGAMNAVAATKFAGREDAFPLIPQDFFPSGQAFFYGRGFPAVVKFGTAHAGYGKIRIKHHHDMDDVRGILPMTTDGYCTAEPLVNSGGDYRLQKIGTHYRAFKRTDVSGAWKTNTGSALLHEVPVTDRFRGMMDAAAAMFMPPGGPGSEEPPLPACGHPDYLDILTVDLIIALPDGHEVTSVKVPPPMADSDVQVPRNGGAAMLPGVAVDEAFNSDDDKVYILEVNGTSSGLGPDHGAADNERIADLVLARLDALYCNDTP